MNEPLPHWRKAALRRMLLISIFEWTSTGILLTAAPIYLVRAMGFTIKDIGTAMTVAAVAGLVLSTPLSALADHLTSKRVFLCMNALRAGMLVIYAFFVRGFISYLIVNCLIQVAASALNPVIGSLITQLAGEKARIHYLSQYRATLNVGITIGGFISSIALKSVTASAFTFLLMTAAAFLFCVQFIGSRLPDMAQNKEETVATRRISMGSAKRILFLAPFDGIMNLYLLVLNVGLPMWILQCTQVPPLYFSLLYIVNTVLCVCLQVWVSRSVTTMQGAKRNVIVASLSFGIACGLFASVRITTTIVPSVVLLVGGVLILTFGELLFSPASSKISYAVADQSALTQSFSIYNYGRISAQILGPLIITTGVVNHGTFGWLGLAGAFLSAGSIMVVIIAKLEKSRLTAQATH